MAIAVTLNEYNGSGATETTGITNIAFGSADATGLTPADYPIRAGQSSYEKYMKAAFAGIVAETISDAKIHLSQGTLKTGETLTLQGLGPLSYTQPSSTANSDSAIPTSLPAGQTLALGGSDTGTLVADGTSDYFRLQRNISGTTPMGQLAALTITITWTEA